MSSNSVESLPFVSVVVPVRNGEETIGVCLRALLATDYPLDRREILVVDNGSTDRTAELIHPFPLRRLWEPERGASNARNRGIRESRARSSRSSMRAVGPRNVGCAKWSIASRMTAWEV